MIPVGLGLVLAGYAVGIWGYCLVRGYNVPFLQLWGPVWPGAAKAKTTAKTAAKGKLWGCSRRRGCSVRA